MYYHLGLPLPRLVVKNLPANSGDIRDVGSVPEEGRSSGGGHGNPLQDSCLGNPMDREPWRAAVHGPQSWTRLKWQHTCSHLRHWGRGFLFRKEGVVIAQCWVWVSEMLGGMCCILEKGKCKCSWLETTIKYWENDTEKYNFGGSLSPAHGDTGRFHCGCIFLIPRELACGIRNGFKERAHVFYWSPLIYRYACQGKYQK